MKFKALNIFLFRNDLIGIIFVCCSLVILIIFMKKFFTFVASIVFVQGYSQVNDFYGLSTGNYAGVHGVFYQPASIEDNRYKFDLNIVSTDLGYDNSFFLIRKDAILKGKFFKSPYNNNFQAVKQDLIQTTNSQDPFNASVQFRTFLPSVLFRTGKKSAMAITLSNRTVFQASNMNYEFGQMIYDNFKNQAFYNKNYNADKFQMLAMNWSEIGLTYSRTLINSGKHYLKAGVTGKLLGGSVASYMQADNLDYAIKNDSTISIKGGMQYGHNRAFETDFLKKRTFSFDNLGFGYEAGLVYEFRGNINKYTFTDKNNKKQVRPDVNPYAVRVGVALLDGGSIQFTKPTNVNDFTINQPNLDIATFKVKSIAGLDSALASVATIDTSKAKDFTIHLATTFSAQIDLHIARGFYINASAFLPMATQAGEHRIQATKTYVVTPRWESRGLGLYVPMSYNTKKEVQLGATLRLGPVFIGSNNVASVLLGKNLKAANVQVGIKIPIAKGRPSRIEHMFNNVISRTDSTVIKETKIIETKTEDKKVVVAPVQDLKPSIDGLSKRIEELNKAIEKLNAPVPTPSNTGNTSGNTININIYNAEDEKGNKKTIRTEIDTVKEVIKETKKEMLPKEVNPKDAKKIESKEKEMQDIINKQQKLIEEMEKDAKKKKNSKEPQNNIEDDKQRKKLQSEIETLRAELEKKKSKPETVTIYKDRIVEKEKIVDRPVEKVVIKEVVKDKVTIEKNVRIKENVLFDTGKWFVGTMYNARLDNLANILKKDKQLKATIVGHTDNVGNRTSNLALSEKRAKEVQDYLIRQGVTPSQLSLDYHGYDQPDVQNSTTATKQLNRRVEVIVMNP